MILADISSGGPPGAATLAPFMVALQHTYHVLAAFFGFA